MYSIFQVNTTVKKTDKGMTIDKMVMGVQFYDGDNRVSGQVVLTNADDNISFTTTQDELQNLAIAKAKAMIASSELPVQQAPAVPATN